MSRTGRLPLRWRVAVAFALAATLTTGLLAVATWSLASSYMVDQKEHSTLGEFSANERLVTAYLRRHGSGDPAQAMKELEYDQDDAVAVYLDGRWYTDGSLIEPKELESVFARLAASGMSTPRHQTMSGRAVLATAVAVPEFQARYLEVSSLNDLDGTLAFLKWVLIAGIGVSFVLGLALGRWAGRQALRPLAELTRTAERVASGDLDARLPERGDADLAPLAVTFNRTTVALQQRVARDARFAADVSHELRSPLTTMINATAVLNRRHDELSSTARHALRLLTADIERFYQMVVDLLEISRDHGGAEQELEACDLVELVRHTLAARHESAPLEVGEDEAVVLADRRRLDRVVANLLDNAERHAGGAVRVAIVREGRRVQLEVDDAGPGVPPELRQQVFERFTRGNRNGNRGDDSGSGLGLALVAQHVRRHEGAVWVQDAPGGGARFVVRLPVYEGEARGPQRVPRKVL